VTTTEHFHALANEGDKITSMRYSKPERRLLSADRLVILILLQEIKEVFEKQTAK
jgi:hypothetical protein